MIERAYTVKEIDDLRMAVRRRYRMGNTIRFENGSSRGERVKDDDLVIEEYVRTSMLAGHTADDLLESEK